MTKSEKIENVFHKTLQEQPELRKQFISCHTAKANSNVFFALHERICKAGGIPVLTNREFQLRYTMSDITNPDVDVSLVEFGRIVSGDFSIED